MPTYHKKTWIILASITIILLSVMLLIVWEYTHSLALRLFLSLLCTAISILSVNQFNKHASAETKQKNWKYLWITLFLFYIIQLIYLLFFDPEFARDRIMYSSSYLASLQQQWEYSTNLVPFQSIQSMWMVIDIPGYIRSYAIINLIGNVFIFMPFAIFMPVILPATKKIVRFFIIMSIIIISVEILQFLTLTGSMDIDDYILNIIGVMLFYILLYHTPLKRYIPNVHTKKEIDAKNI